MFGKTAKRVLTFALTAALLAGSALAAGSGTGQAAYSNTLTLSDGFTYTDQVSYNSLGARVETYEVETDAGCGIRPIVLACDTVYGGMSISRVTQYASSLGYNVIGAVNSDYFDSKHVPLGAVVQDGEYISSPEEENVLTFSGDGSASVSPVPAVSISLANEGGADLTPVTNADGTITTPASNAGKTVELAHLNKMRSESGGLYLYTSAFSTVSTRTDTDGWAVRFKVLSGKLTVSGTMSLQVAEVIPSGTAFQIGDGYVVLTASAASGYSAALSDFAVGDKVSLTTACQDANLLSARWATGCGDIFVSGGTLTDTADWDSALSGYAPRTVLGIKADGSVIYYVVDGRSAGHSDGALMSQTARDLMDRGCVWVVNLDGGGSSAISLRLPGDSACTTLNQPSDGSERVCGAYILFVTDKTTDGSAKRLYLKNDGALVLTGSSLPLSFAASDAGFGAVSVPSDVAASVSLGGVANGVYTAREAGSDVVSLRSASAGVAGTGTIHAVSAGDALAVTDASTGSQPVLTGLALGDTVALSAALTYAGRAVAMDASAVTYAVSGGVGTVTAAGVFTASGTPGTSGALTVSAGGVTVSLEVSLKVDFLDIKGHWAENYVNQLFSAGIVNGTSGATYSPNDRIKRGDFVLMLWRAAGRPAASGASVFTDVQADAYYASAIAWAAENGIANGVGDGCFAPEAALTREQAFALVYRAFGALGKTAADSDAALLDGFADGASVSDYARVPAATLISLGIVGGSDGLLNPQGNLTRAEMAKILCVALYGQS